MSLLNQITTGKVPAPPRVILYGQEGIGKSSWAATAPNPIFIQTENGLNQIDCPKFPLCKHLMMALDQLRALVNEQHDYQTVVIDTIDWLERLIHQQVAKDHQKASIEDIGYAKGYTFALEYWKAIIEKLDALHEKGMIVILLGHAKIDRYEDPEVPSFDRFDLKLHKLSSAYVKEWADAVLFATRRKVVKKEGGGFNERAVALPVGGVDGAGERILRPNGSPACVAKNRYGITASEIPLVFDEFIKLIV